MPETFLILMLLNVDDGVIRGRAPLHPAAGSMNWHSASQRAFCQSVLEMMTSMSRNEPQGKSERFCQRLTLKNIH